MGIRSVELDSELLVHVDGALSGLQSPALHRLLDSAMSTGTRRIVVDLTMSPSIDSGSVSVLCAAAERVARLQGSLVLHLPGQDGQTVRGAGELRAALTPKDLDSA